MCDQIWRVSGRISTQQEASGKTPGPEALNQQNSAWLTVPESSHER